MKTTIIFVLILALMIACGRNSVRVPTITEERSGNYLYGKFIWHDLVTDDITLARDFYAELFGWEFEGRGGDRAPYLTALHNNIPVAGIVKSDRLQEGVNESRWISYISVPDVDKAAGFILNNGGLIYTAPMDVEIRGRLAIVGDNKGAAFGILRANGGDPDDTEPETGTWFWNELITYDPQNVLDFYTSLAGYEVKKTSADGLKEYIVLTVEDKLRAGITSVRWENVRPNWLPYILVSDIQSMITRAEELGASVIIAPDQKIRNGTIAILADPTGAVFGLQQSPI